MKQKKLNKEEIKREIKKLMGKTMKHPFADRCKDNGYKLYRRYMREQVDGRDCGKLMLEWENQAFWGYVVKRHIPVFNKTYKILKEHGNIGRKNAYQYCNTPLWIEPAKDKKVIASIRENSFADDNTHLFIMNDARHSIFGDFRCRTVWPRQNKRVGYLDIKIPSITTYRERNFNFGYGDSRDKGHVFTYSNFPEGEPKAETSNLHKIEHALWCLRLHLEMLKDYEANQCL